MQLQITISWNKHHTIMNIITLVRWIIYAWVMWQVATTPNYIFPMETIQTFGGAFAPLVWWACKYAHGVHRSSTMMKTSWPSFVPLSAHRCCASTICLHSDGDKDRRTMKAGYQVAVLLALLSLLNFCWWQSLTWSLIFSSYDWSRSKKRGHCFGELCTPLMYLWLHRV